MTRALLALCLSVQALPGGTPAGAFSVRETAGLRRFGYPVRTVFSPAVKTGALRLLEEGKPVQAQFTRLGDGRVEIDFNVNLGPAEMRNYQVEEGAGPEIKGGMRVEETAAGYVVRNGNLEFTVPRDLRGFLTSVNSGKTEYLRPGSAGLRSGGLQLGNADGTTGALGAAKAKIVKAGPLACLLRFETSEGPHSVVELEFPRSKSWVEVRWQTDDPQHRVASLMADVNLNLAEPALVDFGAGSMVYVALKKDQVANFVTQLPSPGLPAWNIFVGGQPFATGSGTPIEGWAHAMDRERATAIAVADFAKSGADRLQVAADGRILIRRDFTGGQARALHFWMHFVSMPVQLGAATSPQAMQNPLQVEWK